LLLLGSQLFSCSYDGTSPGVRGRCATATGDPVCEDEILSGEDACWKLVHCASIPVAGQEEDSVFDFPACTRFFGRLSDHRYDLSLACVGASTCDQLRFRNGPAEPDDSESRMPPCLQYGDR